MKLYPQQTEALNAMRLFIESGDSVFILKGYAGTGKTTIIKEFCEVLEQQRRIPKLMAPTGRAAKVLSEKTERTATTIHKAIYQRSKFEVVSHAAMENGIDDMDIYFNVKKITDEYNASDTVIIVDEASLVSSRPTKQEIVHFGTDVLLDDLLTYAQIPSDTKIVFVGDPAQLPPVGDNQSYALSEDYFNNSGITVQSFTLTEVVRQKGDSAILANAMKIRDVLNSPVRNRLCFETKAGEVESVSAADVADKYTGMHPHPALNQSVVICHSNSRTQLYNRIIRQRYYSDERLHNGDILQVVRNNYSIVVPEGYLMNGDFIRIISEPDNVETRNIPVYIKNQGKREQTYIELQFQNIEFETERGTTGKSRILTTLLYNDRPSLTREESVALFIDFMIRHPTLQKRKDELALVLMEDSYFNALQAKFGYAITGHKSQGGEWDTAFVDYTGRTGLDNDSLRWNYTATTRARKCLYCVNMPHITPFNKFSISSIQTITKARAEVLRIKDTSARNAKYSSAKAALEEQGYEILSVSHMPYRDRYKIQGPSGQKEFDCQYNGQGVYTAYIPLQPSEDDGIILKALSDERCYEYDCDYTPSMECLRQLYCAVISACDELGIRITGIKEFPAQYYVLYGLKTTAPFATMQFYFNSKGFITRAIAASALGNRDIQLQQFITRIQELSCL